jgi:hypothetical protein
LGVKKSRRLSLVRWMARLAREVIFNLIQRL